MNMKTLRKILAVICMMALVVCISVGATIAYLTSQDTVVNTFTVGQVGIELWETDVDEDDNKADNHPEKNLDKANEYHLLPGHEYVKDPTVYVDATSEDCYLYVKVINDITDIEDEANTVAAQIEANGWKPLQDVDNVYWKLYDKDEEGAKLDHLVFSTFKIAGEGVDNSKLADYASKTENGTTSNVIAVTAYAIQKDGFNNEVDAWMAGNWN